MQRLMQNSHSSSVDRRARPPMVSNRLEEPMALFAVPLPSSSKSDFLCLCKRLFWSVGTSYFSAFCPLTAEETRLLPHSSAVVQLVSVTPAVPPGNDGKQYLKQDLLAYTIPGDIVGIPYVAISKNHQPRGKLAKAFPFDDLASCAWVPAINAPFVGCTADEIGIGPQKDVFIIKNDEKTRQSLLKGENVIFSQQDGQSSNSEESSIKSAPELRPEQVIPRNLPRKESALPTNVSPTSSSLYKLYNSGKRDTENGTSITPSANGLNVPVKESTPTPPKKKKELPTMVLPRIDAVFSLADSTTTNESLSKKIADTLAKRSAFSSQQSHAVKTSTPVDSGTTSKDAPLKQGDCGIPKSQLTNSPRTSAIGATMASELRESRSGTTRTLATPTMASRSGSVQSSPVCSLDSTRQPDERPSAQTVHPVNAIPRGKTDGGAQAQQQQQLVKLWESSEITPSGPVSQYRQGLENQARSCRRSPGLTVKQILMSRRQLTSPLHFAHSTSVSAGTGAFRSFEAVYANEVADVNDAQTCSAFQTNSDESNTTTLGEAIGIVVDCVNSSDAVSPCEEGEKVKVPPLKMVIKTKRDSDNKVKTTCHPVEEKLADFDGKVLCLKLHKLDISRYSFADSDLIVKSDCESKENASLLGAQETTSVGNTANFQNGDKHVIQPEATVGVHVLDQLTTNLDVEDTVDNIDIGIPGNVKRLASVTNGCDQDGEHKKKKKRRRKFRLTLSKRCKPSHNHDRPTFQRKLERKIDSTLTEGREHLSDCQNTLPKRTKQHILEDLSCNNVSAFDNYFQGQPTDHEPSITHEVAEEFQSHIDGSGKEFATDVSHTAQKIHEFQDDLWSDGASSTDIDSEWECPDKKSAEVDSDWDSSLEDEETNSPFKGVQPIKSSPFGDLQHMVLQDRLRLLEQTLKEHQSVLNAIQRPHDT
ncbi:uncharacterized protein LOC119740731 [Patiria miniata]|uniref:Uncharacterized protein n=1 Tax=Patiria miniata TaxID=46514 RepID=A0A914B8A9_PATMI|nr:uncharacterized protein LOC119740731 [Patiria miniata]XP_038072060.1 uncharacterized protein LOC119740731 [Patiria miniata]